MKLTPLEIKQKKFRTGFRGFDVEEVEEFLQFVSEELEELTRETNEQKDRLKGLEDQIVEYREREQTLKETLLTAQRMADDVKGIAEREARMVISNAEMEGERLIQDAVRRREMLVSEIHDLKRQKVQFETTLRHAIEVHLKMLDALQEYEADRREADRRELERQEAKRQPWVESPRKDPAADDPQTPAAFDESGKSDEPDKPDESDDAVPRKEASDEEADIERRDGDEDASPETAVDEV